MRNLWLVLGVVALVLVVALVGSYNSVVAMNEDVQSKWSQVENQLQRRADLIPNLVATVEGYAVHEEGIFKELANARSRMIGAGGPAEKAAADQQFTSALSRLLVVVENYPNLKADVNFRQLQDELAGTENRLAVARMDYNNAVQAFNTRIKRFPTMLWARMLGFEPYEYFEAQEGAQQVPTVKFKGTGE